MFLTHAPRSSPYQKMDLDDKVCRGIIERENLPVPKEGGGFLEMVLHDQRPATAMLMALYRTYHPGIVCELVNEKVDAKELFAEMVRTSLWYGVSTEEGVSRVPLPPSMQFSLQGAASSIKVNSRLLDLFDEKPVLAFEVWGFMPTASCGMDAESAAKAVNDITRAVGMLFHLYPEVKLLLDSTGLFDDDPSIETKLGKQLSVFDEGEEVRLVDQEWVYRPEGGKGPRGRNNARVKYYMCYAKKDLLSTSVYQAHYLIEHACQEYQRFPEYGEYTSLCRNLKRRRVEPSSPLPGDGLLLVHLLHAIQHDLNDFVKDLIPKLIVQPGQDNPYINYFWQMGRFVGLLVHPQLASTVKALKVHSVVFGANTDPVVKLSPLAFVQMLVDNRETHTIEWYHGGGVAVLKEFTNMELCSRY